MTWPNAYCQNPPRHSVVRRQIAVCECCADIAEFRQCDLIAEHDPDEHASIYSYVHHTLLPHGAQWESKPLHDNEIACETCEDEYAEFTITSVATGQTDMFHLP